MTEIKHETCYVGCNCNQTPTAAHWGSNNLVCYAACNAVLIYDPKWGSGGKVLDRLIGHTKRVNSVRWINDGELVSGSSDHTVIVWSRRQDSYIPFVLIGHESNVNVVDGLCRDDSAVVATAGMDSVVKIWIRTSSADDFVLSQSINYGYSICVGLRISVLPCSTLILACALNHSKIELYTRTDEFCHSATLTGHEDWVRGLDFTSDDKGDVILASSSQDCYIRLWRITSNCSNQLSCGNLIKTASAIYQVFVDSILTGHEGWIYSVNWHPKTLQLLSASLDKSMIIWELDEETKLWAEKIRVGEVGGNTLGFYGGVFDPEGDAILGHGYNGAFHVWRNKDGWEPCVTVGGHFAEVTDLGWEPKGEFLVTVSSDQTTRIHAPWSKTGEATTWHEIARPQIHGFDMSSIAILSRYKFASSAEEKVIRTFQAPNNFLDNFARICNVESEMIEDEVKGASVPSLGLSNKAVFSNENGDEDSHFTAITLTAPPTEETLLQNTLWPEMQKLYGHGYEVYALASSPDGSFLASSCKATTPEHAAIILWDTSTWKPVDRLVSHTLTVVQMSFSPNSSHLLSVSRDRRWSLFSKNAPNRFDLVATTDRKTSIHTRIIWCCGWSHDSKYFATGSRDGRVVVWTRNENKSGEKGILGEYEAASQCLELKNEAITAVAFAPGSVLSNYFIAVGLEVGVIQCFKWMPEGWARVLFLDKNVAHHLTVRRLAFRPMAGRAEDDNENRLQLASCGNDYSVVIHNIVIN